MQNIEELLGSYGESHTHPANVLIHKICVPTITLAVVGIVDQFYITGFGKPLMSVATVLSVLTVAYYFRLSRSLAIGMGLIFILAIIVFRFLSATFGAETLAWLLVGLFGVAWVFQFIGHAVEGKRPSFIQDLKFLLIGPLWTIAPVFRRLGLSI